MRIAFSSEPDSRRLRVGRGLGVLLPLALLTTNMQSAGAQETAAVEDTQSTDVPSDEASGRESLREHWSFLVGAGAENQPRYPGSRFDFNSGLPAISISYGRYFIGGAPGAGAAAGIGAYLVRTDNWALGVSMGGVPRKSRRASDDPILRGWGDIPGAVRAGMFSSYTMEWLSAHASVSAAAHHQGVTASFDVQVEFHPISSLTLSIGPQVILGNEQYAMTFFGIDVAQSEIAGVAPYRARAGVNRVGVDAGARYVLTKHWSLAAHLNYGRLQGDAAKSPVTTDAKQRTIGAFVLYRF